MVSFKTQPFLHRYQIKRRLKTPHSRFGGFRIQKNFFPPPAIKPQFLSHPAFYPGTTPIPLSQVVVVHTVYCTHTVWIKLVFERLTVAQLFHKFTEFLESERLFTVFTTAGQWSLSRARWMQSTIGCRVSVRCVLILFYHLRLRSLNDCFLQGFPAKPMLPIYLYVSLINIIWIKQGIQQAHLKVISIP